MAAVTIRNLSEEAHRALKVRAAQHNRSTEAEMRAILEAAVRPEGRLLLGTAMSESRVGRWVSPMRISRPSNRSAIRVPPSRSILNDLALRMILLDTNVVSEAIKPEPHPSVLAWLDAQAAETLFLSSITVAELLFGIGALPDGKRKDMLAARIDGLLDQFVGRILPSIHQRRGAMPISPSRRARPERAFPRPMAISPRSPPPTGSPSHRATRVRSMPRV